MTASIEFTKWADLVTHCVNVTGCNPFSSEGINIRLDAKTAILRSVDGTEYYDDDLSDPVHPEYTLFGKNPYNEYTTSLHIMLNRIDVEKDAIYTDVPIKTDKLKTFHLYADELFGSLPKESYDESLYYVATMIKNFQSYETNCIKIHNYIVLEYKRTVTQFLL